MSFARYNTSTGIEGEYQPGSAKRVLRNKLGIQRKTEMDKIEADALIATQARYLGWITPEVTFTASLICQMHRDWLGEIYTWAGQYRTVEMSKDGFTWPPAFRIADNMERFEQKILAVKTPFRPSSHTQAIYDMAEIHAELLLIHPFRDGNGRLARWLIGLLCLQANIPEPEYGFTGKRSRKQHEKYLQAVICGYNQDYRALADFFDDALSRTGEA
jgi:cell filamentation protein